jgi:exonuclease SbcD
VPNGRLHLATEPTLLRLLDRHTGLPVQFLLMPYPTPTRYLTDEATQKYQGLDEKNRHLTKAFTDQMHALRESEHFNPDLPAILSAHVGVMGSELHTLFRLSEQEDVVFDEKQLPTGFAYVALGHIHKHQQIGGQTHVRYSGSIEKMDLGEQNDDKGVVLFDVGPEGLVGEPWTLPLESTPCYVVEVLDPHEDIPRLREKYPDAKRHLVKVIFRYTAGVHNREETLRELEQIFPRWYDREVNETSTLGPTLVAGEPAKGRSFEETVRGYLQQELIQHGDAQQAAVLALAEELMKEV